MKKVFVSLAVFLALTLLSVAVWGQCPGCQMRADREWAESGVWSSGWNVKVHPSVNMTEFRHQYEKNREVWDAMFGFLASVDLDTLSVGRYDIVPDNRCYVKVSEYVPREAADVNIEQHLRSIDLQYTTSGRELMGYAYDVAVKHEYNPKKDVAHFTSDSIAYYPATADAFFLFFPSDYHQPSVRAEGEPVQSRKIVCKIEYVDSKH